MFRSELLDLINSGEAWAFIGSGVSIDADCPSWPELTDEVERLATTGEGFSDALLSEARRIDNYPRCFSRIEELLGRDEMERLVRVTLEGEPTGRLPGRLHKMLVDLPFAGYITTNYDLLLERALDRYPGWQAVGNLGDEVRKASGTTKGVVWHVHGALGMDHEHSRLVLTQEDYDALYADESPVTRQLRGLVGHRQVIFIGFGLRDPDVIELLRRAGRLTNPARPLYALLPAQGRFEHRSEKLDLLHRFNIEVITYPVSGSSHAELTELVSVYSSLTLRRSIRYGRALLPPPSYDPETTGLLIYNELVLREGLDVPTNVKGSLLKAWLLSSLNDDERSLASLAEMLAGDIALLAARAEGTLHRDDARAEVERGLSELIVEGYVEEVPLADGERRIRLTNEGLAQVVDHSAHAELLGQQFSASLVARARTITRDAASSARITQVAEVFLKECIARRALGVARATMPGRFSEQDYHMLALLQSVREHLAQVNDASEAVALLTVLEGLLREPTDAERTYFGLAIQARFGMHLLSLDEDTLRARSEECHQTAFLMDSNILIPYIARSSLGHAAATLLVQRLRDLGATIVTTYPMVYELVEHAQFSQDLVGSGAIDLSPMALEAASGRADARSNAFLEGFLTEFASGQVGPTFNEYLWDVAHLSKRTPRVLDDLDGFAGVLAEADIHTLHVENVDGFEAQMNRNVATYADQLARERGATYRHRRQVQAEAEILLLIRGLRSGILALPNQPVRNAWFISSTHVIDDVAGERMTMRVEAALHWLATLRPCSEEQAGAIYNGLLWELQERHVDFVPKETLRTVFRPLLVSARERLDEELERHRELIAQNYGSGGVGALAGVRELDVPTVLTGHSIQLTEVLADRLAEKEAEVTKLRTRLAEAEKVGERSAKKERGRERYERQFRRKK